MRTRRQPLRNDEPEDSDDIPAAHGLDQGPVTEPGRVPPRTLEDVDSEAARTSGKVRDQILEGT